MKSYKVEGLIYYSKLTLDSKHILNDSQTDVQAKLDEYAQHGYRLASTNTISFGSAIYIYYILKKMWIDSTIVKVNISTFTIQEHEICYDNGSHHFGDGYISTI